MANETEEQLCSPDQALKIRQIIREKDWFGFDLDDTLHEFRQASTKATLATLDLISKRYGVPIAQLQDSYAVILREKTLGAFSDGKSSFDYRRERFTALLERFEISVDPTTVEDCLNIYEHVLTESLKFKTGANELLATIKSSGKRIVIISEGPQDAQERTLRALSIDKYVDALITTNYFRVSKTGGLFKKVLEYLEISGRDMIYVGDNESRDITPSIAEGIASIHLDEQRDESLSSWPLRVNTLRRIQNLLLGSQ